MCRVGNDANSQLVLDIGRFYCLSEFDQANLSTTLLLFRYSDRVPTVYRSIHIL